MKSLYIVPLLLVLLLETATAQYRDIAWIRGGHKDAVLSHSISPEGRLLVTGSTDRTIKLWDLTTANLLATLYGHRDVVTSVAFSSDGTTIISGSLDGTVRFWDVASRQQTRSLDNSDSVIAVVYAPSINRIVVRQMNGSWRIRELNTGTSVAELEGEEGPYAAYAWTPNGDLLATGGRGSDSVRIWSTQTGALLHTIHGGDKGTLALAFSPDGRSLVSGRNGLLSVWDVSTGLFKRNLGVPIKGEPWELQFSSSGDTLYVGTDNSLILLRVQDDTKLHEVPILHDTYGTFSWWWQYPFHMPAVSIGPNGQHVVVNGSRGYGDVSRWERPFLELRELDSGRIVHTLTGHSDVVTPLAFLPHDSILISCASNHGEVRYWSPDGTLQRETDLDGAFFHLNLSSGGEFMSALWGSYETHSVLSIFDNLGQGRSKVVQIIVGEAEYWISPGGRYVAGYSMVWDSVTKISSSGPVIASHSHSAAVFSPDASLLAVLQGSEVLLWNMTAQAVERRIPITSPTTLAFSRDGRYLAAGTTDGSITIWETSSGNTVGTLSGHRDTVTSLAFSRGDRFLVSASIDSTVRTWVVVTGVNDYTYDEYPSPQRSVAVTEDGRYIASGADDCALIMWQARGAIAYVKTMQYQPESHSGLRCYPTPSGSMITIECEVNHGGTVEIVILDQLGREVAVVAEGTVEAGTHQFAWDGSSVPAGLYHCRLRSGSEIVTQQVVVVQ